MPTHSYNAGWYALNETRKYPIDSSATVIDKNERLLPHGIIVDAHIVAPSDLGSSCYVSGITITDNLITVVFSTETQPIAVITVPQQVDPLRYYELSPLQEGVTGLVVFGGAARYERGSWLFTSTVQSGLLPDCYTTFERFPVWSIGIKDSGAPYTGVVQFQGGTDLKMVNGTASIDGATQNVLWLGLNLDDSNKQEMLSKYLGECDTRVDSNTCLRGSVQGINSAMPNCSGEITIDGEDIVISTIGNTVLLSTAKKLPEVCPQSELGQFVGKNQCCVGTDYEYFTDDTEETVALTNASSGSVININSSAISLSSGGLEYTAGTGITNVTESGAASFSVSVPTEAASLQISVSTDGYARFIAGFNTIIVNHKAIAINGVQVSTVNSSYITINFTSTGIAVGNFTQDTLFDIHSLQVTLNQATISLITYE